MLKLALVERRHRPAIGRHDIAGLVQQRRIYISKLLLDTEMCAYPIFFFTTDTTTDISDIKESIDSTESKKKSNKSTFQYLLTSLKCRYDIIEPGQRYGEYARKVFMEKI